MDRVMTIERRRDFADHLRREELAPSTVEGYLRSAADFAAWAGDRPVTRELASDWKNELLERGYAPSSVNVRLVALNTMFRFLGWEDCRVKLLRLQRQLFRDKKKELTREEYDRLVQAARDQGKERLALLLETVCGTGIRVSEVKYITVEALRNGYTEISLKGKIRRIMLPGKLARKLMKYARKNKIASGAVFVTRSGRCISRCQIWAEMKALCKAAGVEPSKVFPHNLRHLFARMFYRGCRNIVLLADVLGHSSVETTRIYLITAGEEHQRQLDRLGLVQ